MGAVGGQQAWAAIIAALPSVARTASQALGPKPTAQAIRRAKGLGQNFLLDPAVLSRFAAAAVAPLSAPTGSLELAVEVGPGPGGLTASLLAAGAPRVVAIERDFDCVSALRESGLESLAGSRLRLIHADAREIDIGTLCEEEGISSPQAIRIVGNLPFSVGTRLLVDWMPPEPRVGSFTLLFQKEVAERICAPVGTRDYSRLSVLVQAWASPRLLFRLGRSHFTPAPKVDTAVLSIVPLPEEELIIPRAHAAALHSVTAAAFQQRRKMLRSSLAKLPVIAREERTGRRGAEIGTAGAEALCAMAGVEHTLRAGAVSVAEFGRLAEVRIGQQRQHSPSSDSD